MVQREWLSDRNAEERQPGDREFPGPGRCHRQTHRLSDPDIDEAQGVRRRGVREHHEASALSSGIERGRQTGPVILAANRQLPSRDVGGIEARRSQGERAADQGC